MVAVYSSKAKIKPSDNITLNGVDLMDAIPQYRQVKVSGRGLVGREVNTTTIPARAGVRVNSLQEKPIELEVEYILDCNSNEELRGAFEKLNKILKKMMFSPFVLQTLKVIATKGISQMRVVSLKQIT